jgi:hypothetical protein
MSLLDPTSTPFVGSSKIKISASDISKCCRGKSHTAGGYKWATIETHDKDISELLKQFDL